jgi:hypothetical protein
VLAQLDGEAVAGVDGRGRAERVPQGGVLRDQRRRPRPRRDRVQGLHEAGPDERPDGVALPARPLERLKLADQVGDLGRVQEASYFGGDRTPRYDPACHASFHLVWPGLGRLQPRRGLFLSFNTTEHTCRIGQHCAPECDSMWRLLKAVLRSAGTTLAGRAIGLWLPIPAALAGAAVIVNALHFQELWLEIVVIVGATGMLGCVGVVASSSIVVIYKKRHRSAPPFPVPKFFRYLIRRWISSQIEDGTKILGDISEDETASASNILVKIVEPRRVKLWQDKVYSGLQVKSPEYVGLFLNLPVPTSGADTLKQHLQARIQELRDILVKV